MAIPPLALSLAIEVCLEADYLKFLAKVQEEAKENPWMLSLIFHKFSRSFPDNFTCLVSHSNEYS
jgi:hypothetical protein